MNRRRLAQIVGAGALAFVAMGAAHAVLVRSGAACPMLPPSSDALEAQRQRALPALRGHDPSPSSDAFGFALGTTNRAAFVAASEARGDQCTQELDGALVRCEGSNGELVARFDPKGTLVGADRVRYVAQVADATALFQSLADAGSARLGAPTRTWGNTSAAYMGEPLHQVGVAYRFVDVAVDLSATHLGPGRIAVREQVRAIPAAKAGQSAAVRGG